MTEVVHERDDRYDHVHLRSHDPGCDSPVLL